MAAKQNDENSFIFYKSFQDMVECIPDDTVRVTAYGVIFDYAFSGREPDCDNYLVRMVFLAAKPLIDANNKRRENGRKGGRRPEAAAAEQPAPSGPETCPAAEAATLCAEPAASRPAERPAQPEHQPQDRAKPHSTGHNSRQQPVLPQAPESTAAAAEADPDGVIRYGSEAYPTTASELERFREFAARLFFTSGQGIPDETDLENVIRYTYVIREQKGRNIAVFDQQKGNLLLYAFEQAAKADRLNWRYIEGIYRNFEARNITTLADAVQYEAMRRTNGANTQVLAV